MKVLRLRFDHYLQVVFPRLAIQYRWMYFSENRIRSALFRFLGIEYTSIFDRSHISTKDMKRLVQFCQLLSSAPSMFNKVFTEYIHLPYTMVRSLLRDSHGSFF